MARQLAKQTFRIPPLDIAGRIDVANMCQAIGRAHYRLLAQLSELEDQCGEKAGELREQFLHKAAAIQGD
jgi:hypothetical protein